MNGYDDYSAQYGCPAPPAPYHLPPHHPAGQAAPQQAGWSASIQGQPQPASSGLPGAPLGMQLPPGGAIHLPPPGQGSTSQLPKQIFSNTELVKVTSKSCSNCRSRKVKCDRRYPDCSRCIKRKEECDYGEDVSIALRPTWVLATEASDDAPTPAPAAPSMNRPPYPPHPQSSSTARPAYPGQSSYPYPPPRPSPAVATFEQARSLRTVSNIQHHQALARVRREEEDEQPHQQSFSRLWESFLSASNLGASSSDWRLAIPTLASSLSIHLIDASMHSCCFHLPAFHAFAPEVRYFKENIDNLDLASQVVVGILTSLGARASPHSALLGVAGPDIENGKASLDLVKSAGQRRENAWRAIVDRATELCSKPQILQVPTARNAQTLVAFVQMLMLAEAKPKTARFFLRTAMGVFRDMQHSDLDPAEVQAIKTAVGPTLFESDSRIAAYLSMPCIISDDDLYEYFDGTGVHVPDLATDDLGPLLDDILDPSHGLVTRPKLDRALGLTGYFVCSVQRCFAGISAGKRYSSRYLSMIPQLWSYIDRAHAAVQRLHRRLVQLEYVPEGCDAHHSIDYDLLIGVRMDERLLDVVHLSYEWLKKQRLAPELTPEDSPLLEELLATAERRVRKCLKLLAFYSKVFVDSLDKHVVYHLCTQLEALPNWATMAAQREGEMTEFGPLPLECALTDVELDWFTKALELACFFTPLAHTRLKELTEARMMRQRHLDGVDQWHFDLSVPTPAATPGQPRDISAHLSLPNPPPPVSNGSNGVNGPGRTGSPTWSFDSYGTPVGFVDNVSPPSMYSQTPGSSGSAGSAGGHAQPPPPMMHQPHQHQHHQQHQQQQPPLQAPQYDQTYLAASEGLIPPSGRSSSGNSPTFSRPNATPLASPLDPSPALPFPPPLPADPLAGRDRTDSLLAGLSPANEPSWLTGYDYSAMLDAETSRTAQTPRASVTSLSAVMSVGGGGPGGGGASITELPDEAAAAASAAGMQQMPPPVPVVQGQQQQQQQGWSSYPVGGGGGGGGGW
ncbi:hypothetical protein JCM8097_005780 [Rhodosporidiobolus ruineniae]